MSEQDKILNDITDIMVDQAIITASEQLIMSIEQGCKSSPLLEMRKSSIYLGIIRKLEEQLEKNGGGITVE